MRLFGLVLLASLAIPVEAFAQAEETSDRSDEPVDYPYGLPILGKKASARGAKLQLPWGVSLGYIYNTQLIDLSELELSFNDDPKEPVDFIKFGDNRLYIHALNVRVDMWLLPFLSIYVMGIFTPSGEIDVKLVEPVELDAGTDLTALGTGIGATGIVGFQRSFFNVDSNWSFVWAPQLEGASLTWLLSGRVGTTQPLPKDWSIAWWTGVMYQLFGKDAVGALPLGDVLPPFDYDGARENCDTLGPAQSTACNALVTQVEEKQPLSDTVVNYGIQKGPTHPWNMLVGMQVGYGKHWYFRTEFGILTKFQVMGMATYRFGFPKRDKSEPASVEPAAEPPAPTETPAPTEPPAPAEPATPEPSGSEGR